MLTGFACGKGDLCTVRRPAWQAGLHWRESEFVPISAVDLAVPQSAVGIGNVRNPLSVGRKGDSFGREAAEKWCKGARLQIEAHQLAAARSLDEEDLAPVSARQRRRGGGEALRELHRVVVYL